MAHQEDGLSVRERLNLRRTRNAGSVPETAITNVVIDEQVVADVVPVAEAVDVCPTCGRSGDEPCVTASGNVKSEWHSKRGS